MIKTFNMKIIVLVLLVIMILSFLISFLIILLTGGFNFMESNNNERYSIEKEMDLEGIDKIEISTIKSNINIVPVDAKNVKANLVFNSNKNRQNDMPILIVKKDDDILKIKVKYYKITNIFKRIVYYLSRKKLYVYLPIKYNNDLSVSSTSGKIKMNDFSIKDLNLKTVSGKMVLSGIKADNIDVKVTSGDVKIDADCKDFKLKTVSGDIKSSELNTLNSDMKTTSGNIKLEKFKGNYTGKTVSGDLFINYTDFKNDIFLKSTSGDIKIILPEKAEFKLKFKSTSGKYTSDFPITTSNIKSRIVEGVVVSENNNIEIKSVSGDVKLLKDK